MAIAARIRPSRRVATLSAVVLRRLPTACAASSSAQSSAHIRAMQTMSAATWATPPAGVVARRGDADEDRDGEKRIEYRGQRDQVAQVLLQLVHLDVRPPSSRPARPCGPRSPA